MSSVRSKDVLLDVAHVRLLSNCSLDDTRREQRRCLKVSVLCCHGLVVKVLVANRFWGFRQVDVFVGVTVLGSL